MNRRARKIATCCVLLAVLWPLLAHRPGRAATPPLTGEPQQRAKTPGGDAAAAEFVTTKVKPLLAARCFECHSGSSKKLQGGLRLDSRERILKGGESGPVVQPGRPDKSMLIDAINYRGDYEMPPKTKLPEGEISLLTRWVEMGAPWPEGVQPVTIETNKFPLAERKASHWSWRPIGNPPLPAVSQKDWPRRDLDRFVLAKLEAAGLRPAAAADRRTLARRLWFDLWGLPPTREEVEAFVRDPAPTDQAVEKVVDRLLASPHFGERWARHWLDLMRYAESRGHEFDFSAPNAWQYRNYVIRAINADVPYNDFVVEHIAGDLVERPRLNPARAFNESVLGTGFWYLGDWIHSPVDTRRDETDRIDNMVDTMSRAFLGLTVGCARCHDHKFDAIRSRDYYALAGFIRSSCYRQVRFESLEHNRRVAEQLWAVRDAANEKLHTAVAASLRPAASRAGDYLLSALAIDRGQQSAPAAAAAGRLDPQRLEAWLAELRAAARDDNHPLYLFARVCSAARDPAAQSRSGIVRSILADWQKRRPATAADAKIVVDYSRLGPRDWMQDGFAFGSAPVLPGDLRLGSDAARPVAGVETYGAARRDRLWSGLKLAADSDPEPIRVIETKSGGSSSASASPRAGQTLRSPMLTIESGRLHYLVRGKGMVQAVVDSHRMVAGPLHGETIQTFNTNGKLRWITHSLERYRGHRAQIEFVPLGESLEVLMIADGHEAPPLPPAGIQNLLAARLGVSETATPESLAAALGKLLLDTVDRLGHDEIAHGPLAADQARLADWIVGNPDLFGPASGSQSAEIAATVKRLRQEEQRLGGQIQKTSHTAIAIADAASEDEQLLLRGNSSTPAGPVPRRFLEALCGPDAPSYPRGSGRLELARQMVDPRRDPFVSRVFVNRVWYHLIGRGIVPSVDNFGALGQMPSHLELLDHLSTRFVADGWSLKKLIRLIVSSRTYQMSSRPGPAEFEAADPENVLLHRMNLRRLEGEAIRDAILAVSGRLNPETEGPPVPVHLTEFMTGRGRPESGPLDGNGRRSIYISMRRNFLPPMMLAFDLPVPAGPVGRRNVSNVPAQPLILLNDPFVVEQSHVWAKKVLADRQATAEVLIDRMYEDALGRPAGPAETARSLAFLKEQAAGYELTGDAWRRDPRVWSDLGHVLWNLKEFIFID